MAAVIQGTLVYDGECRFCCLWIERWKELSGEEVEYVPYQDGLIEGLAIEDCEGAVQWVGADGGRASGAEAVFLALASGRASGRILLNVFRLVPPFAWACNFGYAVVAANRGIFSKVTGLLWGREVRKPTFALAAAWFLRLLGVIYLISFVSFWVQAPGLIGERGILPVAQFFQEIEAAMGGEGPWLAPGFLWLRADDAAIAAWCMVGIAGSVSVIAGISQGPFLMLLWATYLSLCVGGQVFYQFQWDALLLEAGFLAVFLAPWSLRAGSARRPPAVARWLLIWLLFRLMISSGAVKLVSGDASWWPDLTALEFHYFTQPLPTPLAWLADQLPANAQKFSVLAMFFIELVLPFFLLGPRRLRHFAVGGMVFLQVLILLTGNYGVFNLLTLALCLLAIDDRRLVSILRLRDWEPAPALRGPVALQAVLIIIGAAIFCLSLVPFTSSLRIPQAWLVPVAKVYAPISPFRSINSYGLFAVMTKGRDEILVQGSEDGLAWETYSFRFKPGDVRRRPPIVAPYMPRLDWQMWFAALGGASSNPWFPRFCERLLESEPTVIGLLGSDPFHGRRPRYVRAMLDTYRFTTAAEKSASRAWWVAEPASIYMPEVALDRSR